MLRVRGASFEVIGVPDLAIGFDYHLDTLRGKDDELNKTFSVLFSPAHTVSFVPFLRGLVPALRWLVSLS